MLELLIVNKSRTSTVYPSLKLIDNMGLFACFLAVQEGAERVVAACGLGDSPGSAHHGVYYVKRQPSAIGSVAGDAEKARELWQLSCEATSS
jgi:hypothetical protein